jgi:hypothetical protein
MNSRKRRKAIFALFATLGAVGIVAFGRSPDSSKIRTPNPHETFYQYVAFELDAPSLCEKLSPSAFIPGGVFIAQSYARSNCYAKIALRHDRPSLCWKAERLGMPAILSEQTSPLSCFVDVIRRAPDIGISTYMPARADLQAPRPPDKYHYGAPTPQTDDETRQIIRALGYPLPDVSGVSANEVESSCFYFIRQMAATDKNANNAAAVAARAGFPARIATLPSY